MSLTFDEFLRLPRSEQNERYRELSSRDKFIARMNDYETSEHSGAKGEVVKLTSEELAEILKLFQKEE